MNARKKQQPNQRRKRRAGSRAEKPSVLLVLQGAVTEKMYFQYLKSACRLPALSFCVESHAPHRMVEKAARAVEDDKEAPFAQVFYVVDKDDSGLDQFNQAFQMAKRRSTKHRKFEFIVSSECFEVWLLAHFEDLKGKHTSRPQLTAKLKKHGAVTGNSGKELASNFPIHDWEAACGRVNVTEPNEVGSPDATAVPHIIRYLRGR